MKIFTILLAVLFACNLLIGQKIFERSETYRYEMAIGSGLSYFSPKDVAYWSVSGELSRELYKNVSIGADLKYGESADPMDFGEYFVNSNLTAYYDLTKSIPWLNLKLGTGLSYLFFQEEYQEYSRTQISPNVVSQSYTSKTHRNLIGTSFIMDNEIVLKEYLTLGTKAYIHPYTNGKLFGGLMLNVGVKF